MNLSLSQFVLILLNSLLISHCGLTKTSINKIDSYSKYRFSDSTRRQPNEVETGYVAFIPGCTAFFVNNSVGKTYIMSARHCLFQNDPLEFCQDRTPAKAAGNDKKYACNRIIATDQRHDLFLYEAQGNPPFPGLRLAGFAPKPNSPLQMIGYPFDKINQGKLILTENCSVGEINQISPHTYSEYGSIGLLDKSFTHNCTTYKGNSGGPMILAGENIAVGLPFNYDPEFVTIPSVNKIAYGAQTSDFVGVFREKLKLAGVNIIDKQVLSHSDPIENAAEVLWWKTYYHENIKCHNATIVDKFNSDFVNIHSEPRATSTIIGFLHAGETFTIKGAVSGNDKRLTVKDNTLGKSSNVWLDVSIPLSGWVSALYAKCAE